jgi:ABC-type multidrug transport system ATPase subunit
MGNQLSGGEQQMLAIGRALMTNPKLLILDEATEGLAPLIRAEIWACLSRLKQEGQAILLVDKHLDALTRIADRHVVIEKGHVVWTGTSDALAADRSVKERYSAGVRVKPRAAWSAQARSNPRASPAARPPCMRFHRHRHRRYLVQFADPVQQAGLDMQPQLLLEPFLFQPHVVSEEAEEWTMRRTVVRHLHDLGVDPPSLRTVAEPLHQHERLQFGVVDDRSQRWKSQP